MNTKKFWNWLGLPSTEDLQTLTSLCQAQEQRLIELEAKAQNQEKALQLLLEHFGGVNQQIDASLDAAVQTLLLQMDTLRREAADTIDNVHQDTQDSKQKLLEHMDNLGRDLIAAARQEAQESKQTILSAVAEAGKQADADRKIQAERVKTDLSNQLSTHAYRVAQRIDANANSSKSAQEQVAQRISDLYRLTNQSAANQSELLRMLIVNAVSSEIENPKQV